MKFINLINTDVDLDSLARYCQPEDAILLRQDAVYLCLRPELCWPVKRVFALQTDLAVRQLTASSGVQTVNARQWVELSAKATQNILWQK